MSYLPTYRRNADTNTALTLVPSRSACSLAASHKSSGTLAPPAWPCRHKLVAPDRFPGGRSKQRTGSSRGLVRATIEVGSWDVPVDAQREAMGIDWMSLGELSEAIPPAYTRFLAEQIAPMLAKEAA